MDSTQVGSEKELVHSVNAEQPELKTKASAETSQTNESKLLFHALDADDPNPEITEIESLCFKCGGNGTTQMLLTKIPFFNEIILSSFSCPHCGYKNSGTMSGKKIQEKGIKIEVLIENSKDLNREIITSDFASISIPELQFEIPALSHEGEVTTVEGILSRAIKDLEKDQPARRELHPDDADKVDEFIRRMIRLRDGEESFHFVIDDACGSSQIENLCQPHPDKAMIVTHYKRTREANELLGIAAEDVTEPLNTDDQHDTTEEVLGFPTNCPSCNVPCTTNMKVTKIPYFKEVIIMATSCDTCGHRTNEVKSGSGTEPLGLKIKLHITDPSDMSRDVLKSETCSIAIPELDFELGSGIIGGKFTTIEGLLISIKEQLVMGNPFVQGDSARDSLRSQVLKFSEKFDEIIECRRPIHIILDDPAGNSYVQNLYAPEPDPEMELIKYERTTEQNEELGLTDMKTENY